MSGEVIELTDLTFDKRVTGGEVWFIDVYAPWCIHCRELEPIWETVAGELKGLVNVGKVDGTKEKVLMRRFAADSFPQLYLVDSRERSTRQYSGIRAVEQMVEFARRGYKDVEPLPFYVNPVSTFGRAAAAMLLLPARVHALFLYLHEEKHYGTLPLLAGGLAVPLLAGLLLICAMDTFAQSRLRAIHVHQHMQ
ncbi:hypothetical protein CVIRNUC_009434 [Coccomyxa viridis]|uniref:Thioredoxin domain-containing protein n=1 Tax=Coccomyxa viridis TaxID=1274662 RepID=A0AAV1IHG4_9CHLO|nr:hypothetical protein CVIRNUC_009434 [Coccomyxa viridis]